LAQALLDFNLFPPSVRFPQPSVGAAARMPAKDTDRKERHSDDPKSSVNAPPKKAGGGGKYTLGKVGDSSGGTFLDGGDPNFDPDEKRIDPDDGTAYKFDELAKFYKGKFTKQAVAEYWEYECKAIPKKRSQKVKEGLKGPTVAESVKPKYVVKGSAQKAPGKKLIDEDLDTDGPLAKEVAAVIPYFPYKKLDKFYDIQGLLKHPKLLNAVCAVMAKRYRKMGVTKIAAFEARGFLFTPVSIKLGVPFIMMRKDGKMPNTVSSAPYTKEYEGVASICCQKDAFTEGDKVVLLDDLIATGGTLCAGIELVKSFKAQVVECGCLIEIKALKGKERCLKAGAIAVWGFISDDLMTTAGMMSENYVDDGKP